MWQDMFTYSSVFGPLEWGNVGRRYGSYQEELAVLHIPENVMLYFLKKYFLINYGCYKDSHIKSQLLQLLVVCTSAVESRHVMVRYIAQ